MLALRLLSGVAFLAAGLLAALTHAQAYEEGVHYERLPAAVYADAPLEVTEVFSYACIHCYTFDPLLEHWVGKLPDDVSFRRMPAVFNSAWEVLARLFYVAELLKVSEKMHTPIFQALHERNLDLLAPEVAAAFFAETAGVDEAAFHEALASFAVQTRVQRAVAALRAYRVSGVPTLVVNGKYRIDSQDAGGYEGMLKVADHLLEAERAAMAAE